jgi:uncharacterized membrane protein YkvA (DUF1232 family)
MAKTALRDWARRIKRDLVAVYLAARDPRVPLYLKLLAGAVVAYALSPIDLIPDFIPVLGYLDDVILVPFGLWLVIRLMPPGLIDEYRVAADAMGRAPTNRIAAAVIIAIWLGLGAMLATWLYSSAS